MYNSYISMINKKYMIIIEKDNSIKHILYENDVINGIKIILIKLTDWVSYYKGNNDSDLTTIIFSFNNNLYEAKLNEFTQLMYNNFFIC